MALSTVETIVLSAVASAIVSLVVSLVTIEYRLKRKQSVSEQEEHEGWYRKAATLGRDTKRTWEREFEQHSDSFGEHDEMKSKLKIKSQQLDTHASEGENLEVDQDVIEALRETASACQNLSRHRTYIGDNEEWVDAGETMKEAASELQSIAEGQLD